MAISPDQIRQFWQANQGNPQAILQAAQQYGIGLNDIQSALGATTDQMNQYMVQNGINPKDVPGGATNDQIRQVVQQNYNDPQKLAQLSQQYGVGLDRIQQATGASTQDINGYLAQNDLKPQDIYSGANAPAPVSAPAPITPTPMADQIKDWFNKNGSDPNAVIQASNQYGISAQDVQNAYGASTQDVNNWMTTNSVNPKDLYGGATDGQIKQVVEQNYNDPQKLVQLSNQYGVGLDRIQSAMGADTQQLNGYLTQNNINPKDVYGGATNDQIRQVATQYANDPTQLVSLANQYGVSGDRIQQAMGMTNNEAGSWLGANNVAPDAFTAGAWTGGNTQPPSGMGTSPAPATPAPLPTPQTPATSAPMPTPPAGMGTTPAPATSPAGYGVPPTPTTGGNTGIVPPNLGGSTPGLPATTSPATPAPSGQGSYLGNGGFAGPGSGQIDYGRYLPQTGQNNPYLSGMADDITRRATDFMNQGLRSARGDAILAGGFGGSGQQLMENKAIQGATDALSGNLANLMGSQYNADASRGLQRYQGDQGYSLGVGNLGNQAYNSQTSRIGTVGGLQNQQDANMMNFYQGQRGQDLQQTALGASLMGQGINMDWQPINNANNTYSPYSGMGSSTTGQQSGGGWQGGLIGALGGANFGRSAGWW